MPVTPRVGEVFELTFRPSIDVSSRVELDGYNPDLWTYTGEVLVEEQVRSFLLREIWASSIEQVTEQILRGGNIVPSSLWLDEFKETFLCSLEGSVGVARAEWDKKGEFSFFRCLISDGGRWCGQFSTPNRSFLENWLWLAQL